MSKEQRQISKFLEPRSFNAYKNATVLIIVMLGCSEINMEVSDADMETIDLDNCREMLKIIEILIVC